MQSSQIDFQKLPIQQIAARIIDSRQITRVDQNILMSALFSKDSLSQEEQNLVQQIYKDLKLGLIRVI
ncbi:MAG TPA: hypothetical protein DCP31_21265 [Cyanobacteria bacterium UBA8543]|nr:hypothetical protein [Cyanobacteria bacterium UBA8543]